jgi:hypothetical protein
MTCASLPTLNHRYTDAQNLLGYTAVFLIGCWPTFQRCVLPPSSGRWGSLARNDRWLYRLTHRPDDGGSAYLWNVGRHSIKNTAVHPRRFWASYPPPWEHEISPRYTVLTRRKNFSLALSAQNVQVNCKETTGYWQLIPSVAENTSLRTTDVSADI